MTSPMTLTVLEALNGATLIGPINVPVLDVAELDVVDLAVSGTATVGGNAVVTTALTANTTQAGIVELATTAETQTGTDTARAVTPAGAAGTYLPLSAVSAYILTLLDDPDASTAQTTLGISAFVKTILDDTSGAAVWATLGAIGSASGTNPGYIKFPSGLIIQYGSSVQVSTAAGLVTFTLPITMSAAPIISIGINGDWGVASARANPFVAYPPGTTSSQVAFASATVSTNLRVNWIVIGFV